MMEAIIVHRVVLQKKRLCKGSLADGADIADPKFRRHRRSASDSACIAHHYNMHSTIHQGRSTVVFSSGPLCASTCTLTVSMA
jgi:hypothetical protein